MSNKAIIAENLSKAYLIGLKDNIHESLGEALISWLKYPFKNYSRIKKLNTFKNFKSGDDIFWALNDVTFDVNHGEVLGIIGANGAGKSTLLKILSRITEPTNGKATVYGRVSSLLEVGTGFNPELTGRENIYLNGTILGMTKKEVDKKFDEIVDFSGIEKFIDTQSKKYSNGMRIRLAFAIAANIETEITIIDEVLNVGDAEFQRKSMAKMESLAKSGRTVLFVSHNLSAVKSICTRAINLYHGKLIREGDVDNLISAYLSQYNEDHTLHKWDIENAPSNEFVKLIKAELLHFSDSDEPLKSGEPFELEFTFYNLLQEESFLDIVFQLKDELDNLVFVGSSINDNNKKIGKGYFKWNCKIPADLMNQGSYSINKFYLIKDKTTVIFEHRNILSFEIIYSFDLRIGNIGRKEGIIKPKLNWEILTGEFAES